MSDPVIRRVRRSIEESRKRGGMRAGMPGVTIDAGDAERLCILSEGLIKATSEAGWHERQKWEAQEQLERLQAANRDLQDWFDDARAAAEQAQARVAEMEDALSYLREPWDLGQMLGAETRRRVEFADSALAGNKTNAWLLRKQAEAVEYCWTMADEASSLEWLINSLADHQLYLIKQANEQEAGKAGGEQ